MFVQITFGIVQTELSKRLLGWNIKRSERIQLGEGLSGKALGLGAELKIKFTARH